MDASTLNDKTFFFFFFTVERSSRCFLLQTLIECNVFSLCATSVTSIVKARFYEESEGDGQMLKERERERAQSGVIKCGAEERFILEVRTQ